MASAPSNLQVNIWDSQFGNLHTDFRFIIEAFEQLPPLQDFPDQRCLSQCAMSLGIKTATGVPIQFIPAKPRPRGAARRRRKDEHDYELRIFNHGEVSTRSRNWHDFFNALVWMTYPATKAALNARQIAARVPGIVRTREQDRLTMFDEGGVITVVAEDGSVITRHIIGHAIFELICQKQLPVRGMQLVVPTNELQPEGVASWQGPALTADLDRIVATKIRNQVFTTSHASCLITN